MSTIGIDSAFDSAVNSDTAQQLQQGFDALNRGQLEVAAQACQTVLAKQPELAPAHFLVGLIAIEGDERRVAHEAFKSVVKLDRDHAAAWAQLARLNASEGRIARAESALKEVRRIQPTDPAVLDLTGTVLNQLGEYPTAKAFFAQVNKQAPGKTGYMMNLANAWYSTGTSMKRPICSQRSFASTHAAPKVTGAWPMP